MFPSRALCLPFHFLGLRSFPLTLSYCTSLTILRSRTRLLLRRIRSLVYILRVLVTVDLRTNIAYFSLVSVWGSSERSDPPARLRLSTFSSVLELAFTGGKGQYTQWVHCELIVGSETICPAHTRQVNSGHIQKVPTHLPSPNPAGK